MKNFFYLTFSLLFLQSCKEQKPNETNTITIVPNNTIKFSEERSYVLKAKDLLTAAENQAKSGIIDPKQYEEIITTLTAAIKENDRYGETFALRGWAKMRLNQPEEAINPAM